MSGLKELLKNPGFCGMMVGHHNGGISPEPPPALSPDHFLTWRQGFRIFAPARHPIAFITTAALYPTGPEGPIAIPQIDGFLSGP